MMISLSRFKTFMCMLFLILFQCISGISQEIVSFENAEHLKEAYEKIEKSKERIDYKKLIDLYLSRTTAEQIEQSISEFEDIIDVLKEGLTKNESFKVNIDDLHVDSNLSFIGYGRTLSLLLLLESKMYFEKGEYADSVKDIFITRQFANQLSENGTAIALLVNIAIKNLSRILMLDMVKRLPDEKMLNVVLFNLENEAKPKEFRDVLLMEEKMTIKEVGVLLFNDIKQKIERRMVKAIKEDNFSLCPIQLDKKDAGLKVKKNDLFDQIKEYDANYDFDIDKLEAKFNQRTHDVFQEVIKVISSDESYIVKRYFLDRIIDSLEYHENKLVKVLLSGDEDRIYTEYVNILLQLLFTPLAGKVYDRTLMDQALEDLLRLSIAVEIYKRRTGEYPQSLVNLNEVGFTKLPQDIFSGLSYGYRKESKEGFIAWSVGPDVRDDKAKEKYDFEKDRGDVFIRSCE